eukprot:CAMPEP_0113298224 /NCGR_PEP_ID=MMETSP0010_2-20120614/760_1 /TAXON_ID=216773 ORGANISM="Corethron hystrix, Strain 308" /NCGR_SAMPLE_ID=MMETSP0010_2 /ASSEMBLY_ACC=CAM_ASM_000155 /LENGTH=139 /DNA_ID=CAMNT_0000151247 /DNA_START=292 /DNA_END=709 /DNA_ORIENTATION=- /assembly_acc=CAM_ASM_000155
MLMAGLSFSIEGPLFFRGDDEFGFVDRQPLPFAHGSEYADGPVVDSRGRIPAGPYLSVSSLSSSVVGIQKGSSPSTSQCEKVISGVLAPPEVFFMSSCVIPKTSPCGTAAVMSSRSVPSTAASFVTLPLLLASTAKAAP